MATECLLLACISLMRKCWEIMSSLQSDLKELRSLQFDTPSLSQDSRSVRYEPSLIQVQSSRRCVPSSATGDHRQSLPDDNQHSSISSVDKGALPEEISKKRQLLGDHKHMRQHSAAKKPKKCESSNFNYMAPEQYPKYPSSMYRALKAGLGIYDLLALVHIVPAPWDHALKPPYYPPIPLPTLLKFSVIDFD